MASKKKGKKKSAKKKIVMLVSTGKKKDGSPTGTFFVKPACKDNIQGEKIKLSLRKYDPVIREHVMFVEKKMPKSSA